MPETKEDVVARLNRRFKIATKFTLERCLKLLNEKENLDEKMDGEVTWKEWKKMVEDRYEICK